MNLPSPPLATDRVCRAVTKTSRSNFAYAFLVLPKPKREALYAVYAFCRISDDAVDESPSAAPDAAVASTATPSERLRAWRRELDACFRGEPRHPVMRRLAEVLETIPIPRVYFEELLNGVEMDLVKTRYASFAELERYCYRVAGVVGLMCIEVFGYTRPETRRYAEHLGTAFQLTNILRDVGRDAAQGRIYLPQEDLARFGCTEADILDRRLTPAFRDLMRFEAARARQCYDAARAALPSDDRRSMLPAEIMRAIYVRLLGQIERRAFDVYSRPIRLSNARRLALAFGCWARHRLAIR
ncbi:MAG: squalene synthase HpnD [candidate division NC10 bacterium RBG_16_65_8]|nr:MAG: squalene synthase HpnD [candidate division NC10 bacterium RBG_16_65_8]